MTEKSTTPTHRIVVDKDKLVGVGTTAVAVGYKPPVGKA
jgi:hypothetical protein